MIRKFNNIDLTSQEIFERNWVAGRSCLLESSSYHPETGRYSIIATHPVSTFYSFEGKIYIKDFKNNCVSTCIGDPLLILENILADYINGESPFQIPFSSGGAIGYLSYDLARNWIDIGESAIRDIIVPDIYLMFYKDLIVFDHLEGAVYLINNAEIDSNKSGMKELGGEYISLKPEISKEVFIEKVLKVKEYIAEGEIYQANISQRLSGETSMRGWEIYKMMSRINPSPFSAYLDFGEIELISCSPERLLKRAGDYIETCPIAGTYPRGVTTEEDTFLKERLPRDPKEAAEHIMLVDLERNDLGRVCEYGSVYVKDLMRIETYSYVHHIVSTVVGTLKNEVGLSRIIKAAFPGGTITGCPKIRCMEIIEEVEPVRRSIYTGSICYLGFNGYMDLNIIIRTLLKIDRKIFLQVGAGIVADSIPEREYEETLHKARAFLVAEKFKNVVEKLTFHP